MDKEVEYEIVNSLHEVLIKYREKGVIIDDIISVTIKYACVTAFSCTNNEGDAMELIRDGAIEARNVNREFIKRHYDNATNDRY